MQPQHRLHIDDDPLQGKGQSVKEFILRDDLQPQMAAGQRAFSNARSTTLCNIRCTTTAVNKIMPKIIINERGGIISIPKAAICDINSCITSPEYPAGMMTAGYLLCKFRRRYLVATVAGTFQQLR